MNSKTAEKHKEEGTRIIILLTTLISNLDSFFFGFIFWGKKTKEFNIMTGHYSDLTRDVVKYNETINADISIGLSQNIDQIYPLKMLNYQRMQIQDLMTQALALLSSKKMELQFGKTLIFSTIALVFSLISIIINISSPSTSKKLQSDQNMISLGMLRIMQENQSLQKELVKKVDNCPFKISNNTPQKTSKMTPSKANAIVKQEL